LPLLRHQPADFIVADRTGSVIATSTAGDRRSPEGNPKPAINLPFPQDNRFQRPLQNRDNRSCVEAVCRARKGPPNDPIAFFSVNQEQLDTPSGLKLVPANSGRQYLGLIDYESILRTEEFEDVCKRTVLQLSMLAIHNKQTGLVTMNCGIAGDARVWEVELKIS